VAELESLTVSLDDQFSQSANTAAASAGNLATGLDKVTTSSQATETVMRTRGQTVDSINKKIADQASLTDRLTTIEQKYQAAVAIKIASMQAEAASASEIAEAIRRLGVVRDEDVQKATSSFQKLDQKFVATQQAAVQTAQSIADAVRSSASALDGLIGKYDAVYAATQRTASARQEITGLLNSNNLSISQYDTLTAALGKVEQGYRSVLSAAEAATQAERNATAAQGQSIANTFAGVKTQNIIQDDTNYKARAADIEAYGQALDHARAKIDPLFAAEQQYKAKLQEIAAALATGAAEEDVATAARIRAKASYDNSVESIRLSDQLINNVGTSSRNLNTQSRLLTVQLSQMFSGLATGQPVFTTLVQQLHQVYDSFAATGAGLSEFGAIATKVWNAVTSPIGLVVSGIVAVGAVVVTAGIHAESFARQWATLSAQLSVTRTDFATLADAADASTRRVAASTGLSVSEALSAYKILASSSSFRGTQTDLENLIALTGRMARAFGTDVPEQAQKLTAALVSPTAAIKKMAEDGIKTADYNTVQFIESLERQGKKFEAQTAVVDAYRRSLTTVKDDGLTPLQKAFEDLGKATTLASGKGLFQGLGEAVINDLTHFVQEITTLIDSAKAIRDWVESKLSQMGGTGTVVDANTGKATAGVTLPAQYNGVSVSQTIYDVAEANHISASVADLATRVAKIESGGGYQFNADGTLKTNNQTGSDARYGIGQVSSALASQYGQDYSTVVGNITTMLKYLDELSKDKKFAGNEQYIAAAYNWGPGNFSNYLSGQTKTLPDETAKYVQSVTGSPLTIQATSATIEGKGGTALANNQIVVSGALSGDYMTRVSDALSGKTDATDTSAGNVNATRQAAIESATKYANALEILAAAGITSGKSVDELTARMNAANAAATNALTPAQEYIRSLKDQSTTTAAATEGDKALAAVRERIAEIERSTGTTFSQAEKAEAEAAAVTNLSNALKATEFEMNRQVTSNEELATAYGQGYAQVGKVTAAQAAYQTLLKDYPHDAAAIQAALPDLANKYQAVATAAQDAKTAQSNASIRDNITYIQAETASLGENEAERTRNLAVLKATQDNLREYKGVLTDAAKENIALAAATADATSAFQHQQAVTSELSNFFTNTFDTISNSITSAFANGTESALKFKDIAKSVASAVLSEFVKLAVVNPLKSLLFGSTNSTVTLSDVTGMLGGSSVGSSSSGVLGSIAGALGLAGGASAFSGGGTTITAASGSSGSSGGSSPFDTATSVLGAASSADSAGLLGGGSGGLIAGLGSKVVTYITDALGNTTWASGLATASGNAGSSIAQLAAGLSDAVGASSATSIAVASAASTVAEALPYIGAVVSIGTSLLNGNYIQAGATAAGAAIGTVILPGIGTAIGATLGNLVGGLFGGHAKNSYQGTQVMVENGQVVSGQTASQVQSSDEAVQSINDFGTSLNTYMNAVGIKLTNLDSLLGVVGQGINGLTEYSSVADPAIFSKLQFDRNTSDTSNFGVAKGALSGMSFNTVGDLNNELLKIAGFATAVDAVGIQLKAVGKDLANIQIAGVTGANANALGSVTDASGNIIKYHNDLRTALNADLPTQTFADTTALDTEISKVNTFVNGTLPSLLTPIEQTTSSITTAVANIDKTYSDAINQSLKYGLDNTAVLRQAEDQAIAIIRRTALMALDQTNTSINDRLAIAYNDNVYTQQKKTLDDLAASNQNEIEAYTKSWTDIFGDGVKSTDAFKSALGKLVDTLNLEYANKVKSTTEAIKAQADALAAQIVSLNQAFQANYVVRDLQAKGQNEAADLLAYDIKALQERQTYINEQIAVFGNRISNPATYTADQRFGDSVRFASDAQNFQDQLAEIDRVHAAERAAIEKKYADAAVDTAGTTANAIKDTLSQAQGNIVSLFTSLKSYAHTLQTGSDSPLSPTDQYALASSQFDAVSGAARAGDYNSATQLQTYAESLISASRSVYGSGAQYSADVTRVLDAISGTSAVADTLTLSAQQKIVQDQTAAIVDAQQQVVTAVNDLRNEVIALRREQMNTTRAMALAA
jgi:CHAD domain-containing protein